MAAADLQIVIQAVNKASSELDKVKKDLTSVEKAGGGVSSSFTKVRNSLRGLALPAAAAGFTAVGGAIAYSIKQAAEAQKVQAQLGAVLKSTKGVAGVTADAVNELSDELQQLTTYDDEAITSAQSLLLTFTRIGKDIFPEATEATLNMSTALGQDLSSSAIQLGKALNDPINGATALRRVGVALTEQQREQIRTFVESGDILSAQKVILQELQTEFGGAAKAAGQTFAGQLQILRNNLDNVAESIGVAVLPLLSDATEALNEFVTEHRDDIERLAELFTENLAGGVETTVVGIETLVGVFDDLAGDMGNLEGAAIALGGALAFLFPEAALLAGLVAIVATIGVFNLESEEASDNALRFKAAWLDAIADVVDAASNLPSAFLGGTVGTAGRLFDVGAPFGSDVGEDIGRKLGDKVGDGIELGLNAAVTDKVTTRLRAEADKALAELDGRLQSLDQTQRKLGHFDDYQYVNPHTLDRSTAALDKHDGAVEDTVQSYEALAKSVRDATDLLFGERSLEDVTLERQIADVDALISSYQAAGREIPPELEAVKDQLEANKRAAGDLADAATLNFEEIRLELLAMGADGEQAVADLIESLEGLPEQERIEVITEINQQSIEEVNQILEIMRSQKVEIDVALAMRAQELDALERLRRGEHVPQGALPTARAAGGIVRKPELALIGEDGPEAVLPLSKPERMSAILRDIGFSRFANGFSPVGESGSVESGPFAVITINAPGGNAQDIARQVARELRDQLGVDTLSGPRIAPGAFTPGRA